MAGTSNFGPWFRKGSRTNEKNGSKNQQKQMKLFLTRSNHSEFLYLQWPTDLENLFLLPFYLIKHKWMPSRKFDFCSGGPLATWHVEFKQCKKPKMREFTQILRKLATNVKKKDIFILWEGHFRNYYRGMRLNKFVFITSEMTPKKITKFFLKNLDLQVSVRRD